jgi:hypothetical protein
MCTTDLAKAAAIFKLLRLKKLTLEDIRHIDQILAALGDYGEIHLVVQHGELRYINKVESFKAWTPKWKNEPNR